MSAESYRCEVREYRAEFVRNAKNFAKEILFWMAAISAGSIVIAKGVINVIY